MMAHVSSPTKRGVSSAHASSHATPPLGWLTSRCTRTIPFHTTQATEWDPDPGLPYIEVTIIKNNKMVGLKVGLQSHLIFVIAWAEFFRAVVFAVENRPREITVPSLFVTA